MKFTALPVNVGDSFLLRTGDKVILVDGGMNKQHILKLLCKEKITKNHIDLLICTHYDADHINGIIGILKSQKFSFNELWLPEILGSIGYTLSKKNCELLRDLRCNKFPIEEYNKNDHPVFEKYDSKVISDESSSNNSFEKIDNKVLRNINRDFHDCCDIFWHDIRSTSQYKMMSSARSVASLVSNALNSGAYIRWLKYQKQGTPTYGFNIFCQNSIQTDITLFDSKLLFSALHAISLSKINKYSLVFLYRKEDVPDVLFTADSDLSFYSAAVTLKDNSIVTAPHHGSSANNAAYKKISGKNLTYVRSDRSQSTRPGKEYLNNKNRFCTICRNITPKKKVELTLSDAQFKTTAKLCGC